MAARIAEAGDPWADLSERPQSLGAALEALSSLVTPEELKAAHAARSRKSAPRKGTPRG
jgi:hypothetical protein